MLKTARNPLQLGQPVRCHSTHPPRRLQLAHRTTPESGARPEPSPPGVTRLVWQRTRSAPSRYRAIAGTRTRSTHFAEQSARPGACRGPRWDLLDLAVPQSREPTADSPRTPEEGCSCRRWSQESVQGLWGPDRAPLSRPTSKETMRESVQPAAAPRADVALAYFRQMPISQALIGEIKGTAAESVVRWAGTLPFRLACGSSGSSISRPGTR